MIIYLPFWGYAKARKIFVCPWYWSGRALLVFMSKHLWIFWTYDKLHIIVFIVMKMIIILGGMLHPISLRSDKLVSRGCIQLFFFCFVLFAHVYVLYDLFFVKSNIWYSFGTYCEKGALLFSLSVNVYCWNWTHTASRWEKHQKKAMGNIQNANAKQKLTKTDITLIYA